MNIRSKRKLCSLSLIFSMIAGLISNTPVSIAKTKVRLSKTKISLTVKQNKSIILKGVTKKVKWSNSKKKVVAIKATGKYKQKCKLTAKTVGTAIIKAKYKGKTYKCKVTIKPKSTKTKSISKVTYVTTKPSNNTVITRPDDSSVITATPTATPLHIHNFTDYTIV